MRGCGPAAHAAGAPRAGGRRIALRAMGRIGRTGSPLSPTAYRLPPLLGVRQVRALTAAEELLLAACRGDVREGSTADWLAALALAQHHQLSALLCAALCDASAAERP